MIYSDTKLRHFLNIIAELGKIIESDNTIIQQRHNIQVHIVSAEPAGRGLIGKLGLHAVIDGGLKLGEGTGGILLLPLLDGAAAIYYNSHRFDVSGIERDVELK